MYRSSVCSYAFHSPEAVEVGTDAWTDAPVGRSGSYNIGIDLPVASTSAASQRDCAAAETRATIARSQHAAAKQSADLAPAQVLNFGSSQSRIASPKRLNENTDRLMAKPGKR